MSEIHKFSALIRHGKVPLSMVDTILKSPPNLDKTKFVNSLTGHPDLSEKHILQLANHPAVDDVSGFYRLMKHENIKPNTISKLIKTGDDFRARQIFSHPEKLESHHIQELHDRLFSIKTHDYWDSGSLFAKHPKTPSNIIHKIIDNGDDYLVSLVAKRDNNEKDTLDKLMSNKNHNVVADTVANSKNNPNFTKEHLERAITHQSWYPRSKIATHPLATKEHLDKLIDDTSEDVVASVFDSKLHTKDHYKKAVKHPSGYVRVVAQESPFAKVDKV